MELKEAELSHIQRLPNGCVVAVIGNSNFLSEIHFVEDSTWGTISKSLICNPISTLEELVHLIVQVSVLEDVNGL